MSQRGRAYLRGLATRVRDIAREPIFPQKQELWRRKNRLLRTRPLVLCALPEEVWPELIPPQTLRSEDPFWRGFEWHFLQQIYRWEHIRDDGVITDRVYLPLRYRFSDWAEDRRRPYAGDGRRAEAFHPVILQPSDLKKLRQPELLSVDTRKSAEDLERAVEAFGDILSVVQGEPFYSASDNQVKGWGLSGIDILCELRGLENVLIDLAENPGFVDEAMAFICDGLDRYLDALERNGLLRPNNNEFIKASNTPLGSNGLAITDELPGENGKREGFSCRDLWGYAMAQEFAGVSPEMHERHVLRHQRKLGARFGLLCYGCCEANDRKWESIFAAFPNLRSVSVSHCADLPKAVEMIGDRYVFSWKPNSSTLNFCAVEAIREQLREGLRLARECHLVVSLRDTLSFEQRPERAWQWTRIAMELAESEG